MPPGSPVASAGWQQVNTSRSRSSSTGPVGSGGSSSVSIIASAYLSWRRFSRRSRSSALSGRDRGQPAARVGRDPVGGPPLRRRPARPRRWRPRQDRGRRSGEPGRPPRARAPRGRPTSGRQPRRFPRRLSGSLGLERPDLDGSLAGGRAALGDLEGCVEIGCLDDPESAELLLGLGVGPVGDQDVGAAGVDDRRRRGLLSPPAKTQLPLAWSSSLKASTWAKTFFMSDSFISGRPPSGSWTESRYCVMAVLLFDRCGRGRYGVPPIMSIPPRTGTGQYDTCTPNFLPRRREQPRKTGPKTQ